jgi:hypothetical protein
MSLLYEMEKYGLADCEFNRNLWNRQFLTDDIMAMAHWSPDKVSILGAMDNDTLYALWRDYVNLTAKELTE